MLSNEQRAVVDWGVRLAQYCAAARAHAEAMNALRRALRARRRAQREFRDSSALWHAEIDAADAAMRTLNAFAEIKGFRVQDHKDWATITRAQHLV